MTRFRLQSVNEYRDRHGKVRRYFRRAGFKRAVLPRPPGSAELMAAYQAALDRELPKEPIGASRNAPGSVAAAVSLYLGSTTFEPWPSTRAAPGATRKKLTLGMAHKLTT